MFRIFTTPVSIHTIKTHKALSACLKSGVIAALLMLAPTLAAAAGYHEAEFQPSHREEPVALHVWYPSSDNAAEVQLGQNLIFPGHAARPDAEPLAGKFPLVLLSHGSGGNAINLGWLASRLADRGMIVIAPNHPGTTSGDSIPAETVKIWQRPMDMSAILDHLPSLLPRGLFHDPERIGAIGFSMGGHTAMALAGARASKSKFIRYCDQYAQLMDCAWYRSAGVDLSAIDQARYESDLRDSRIAFAVVIDPALSQAYEFASLEAVTIPMLGINLGGKGEIPAALDLAAFGSHLPFMRTSYISHSEHFSFLGACTFAGKIVIMLGGDDPICSDPGGKSRNAIHAEAERLIGKFLMSVTSSRPQG